MRTINASPDWNLHGAANTAQLSAILTALRDWADRYMADRADPYDHAGCSRDTAQGVGTWYQSP
jgi:hypothetical protein